MTDATANARQTVASGFLKKWLWIGGALALGLLYLSSYNGLTTADENVKQSYSHVQVMMQRQADLLPNLAATVKGYASHEQATYIDTAAARAGALSRMPLNPKTGKPATRDELANDAELQRKFTENQQALGATMQQAMVAINAVRESNPTLKADTLFIGLMSQIEGSQNRITVARNDNQAMVGSFNRSVRQFPRSVIASIHGFGVKPYFEAEESAQKTPQIKF